MTSEPFNKDWILSFTESFLDDWNSGNSPSWSTPSRPQAGTPLKNTKGICYPSANPSL